jgi:hypothetical protein
VAYFLVVVVEVVVGVVLFVLKHYQKLMLQFLAGKSYHVDDKQVFV